MTYIYKEKFDKDSKPNFQIPNNANRTSGQDGTVSNILETYLFHILHIIKYREKKIKRYMCTKK